MFKTKESDVINTKYIDVLDGVRAFAIIMVLIFHFWQQTWITPVIRVPFLKFIGLDNFNTYYLLYSGFEYVDLMIFLSAFCLFLPHAREMISGGSTDDIKTFYKKRIARIFPSYYFCVLVFFAYNLATNAYSSTAFMLKDILTHLTFTQIFFSDISNYTLLNPVLWTICIEIWFYILFPFIADAFKKRPLCTYAVMTLVSLAYINFYVLAHTEDIFMLVNSFPSFLCVFANGMMGAVIVVALAERLKREKFITVFFTALCLFSIGLIYYLMQYQFSAVADFKIWQIKYRYIISLVFGLFVISLIFSARGLRLLFANRVTKFLAFISMNLYIWHQQIAAYLKEWRIPYWTGEIPPNEAGDTAWQWKYAVIIVLVAFAAATGITYLVEKPCADLILRRKKNLKNEHV